MNGLLACGRVRCYGQDRLVDDLVDQDDLIGGSVDEYEDPVMSEIGSALALRVTADHARSTGNRRLCRTPAWVSAKRISQKQ
jgi:hypothetical protein